MLIPTALIQRTKARMRFDPAELARKLGEGDRSKRMPEEVRVRSYSRFLAETGSASRAHLALERLMGGNDLTPISYLTRGVIAAKSVCRIRLRDSSGATVGFGTGFLTAPGVLMTNHHVIGGSAEAAGAIAEFNYELDLQGQEKPVIAFEVQTNPPPITLERLDFCLVAVADASAHGERVTDFGWLPLNPTPGKTVIGEYLTIIQHPGGEPKQVCVRENKLLKYDDAGDTLWYNTDTVAGSSGSPVFNNGWEVVALHHSGVPKTDAQGRWLTVDGKLWDPSMDESRVAWVANEGIRISRIMEYLAASQANHPIAQAVLRPPTPPPSLAPGIGEGVPSAGPRFVDGELRFDLPISVAIKVDTGAARGPSAPALHAPSLPTGVTTQPAAAASPVGVEKVEVDQSDYGRRRGYRRDFLGGGAMAIPFPTVKSASLKRDVASFTVKGKKTLELKYWNYSVMMHRRRRLAIVSAVNVDANLRPSGAGRDGDRWYFDTRLPEERQLGPEFYGEQKTFEADRSKNPFDRGHLTRRLDAQWGADAKVAKRNGDDSFHWTNCSPQHWRFNEGSKRWLGLEDYVISTFAHSSGKASVFNGPVFDAPLSTEGPDGRITPTLTGKGHKDPTFGAVAIPRLFYKIVACQGDDRSIAAAAFLMSQEDLLGGVARLHGMPSIPEERLTRAEAKLYQVRVRDIEALTGLDFGPLRMADVSATEAASLGPRLIGELSEVKL